MPRWSDGLAFVLSFALVGCAGLPPAEYSTSLAGRIPERVELTAVPFHAQDDFQCGPAALASVLASAGVERSVQELSGEVYLPQRQGSLQPEMLAAVRRSGVLPYVLEARSDALLREVAAGHPVVVLQNLRFDFLPQWHYAVVVGYDLAAGTVVLRSGSEPRRVMRIEDFDRTWAKAGRWAFVALPPERIPATARAEEFVAAALALERVSPTSARQAYLSALDAWPDNLLASLALGNLAYRQHQFDSAEAAYRSASVAHPDAADAWNNLAQVLHDTGRRQEALAAAQRAVEIGGPRLTVYQSTLKSVEMPR